MAEAVGSGLQLIHGNETTYMSGSSYTAAQILPIVSEDLKAEKVAIEEKTKRKGYITEKLFGRDAVAGGVTLESQGEGRENWLAALLGIYTVTIDGARYDHKFEYAAGLMTDEPPGIGIGLDRGMGTGLAADLHHYKGMLPTMVEFSFQPNENLKETWTFVGGKEEDGLAIWPATPAPLTIDTGFFQGSMMTSNMITGILGECIRSGSVRFGLRRAEDRPCFGGANRPRAIALRPYVEFEIELELSGTTLAMYKKWRDNTQVGIGAGWTNFMFSQGAGATDRMINLYCGMIFLTGSTPNVGDDEGIVPVTISGETAVLDGGAVNLPYIELTNPQAAKVVPVVG